MPLGVNYSETEYRLALAIAEALSGSGVGGGTGGSTTPGSTAINDGAITTQRLAINNLGQASINFTDLINSVLSGAAATGVKLNSDSIFFLRDANNFPAQTTFTIAAGATQTEWKTIMSPHKLLLLETPTMTGTSLQVRWRHPITPLTTGAVNPIVDAFGTPIALTIGATGRTFSSDALAPLARCVLGDGEISFVSNVAEGAQRTLKLYY